MPEACGGAMVALPPTAETSSSAGCIRARARSDAAGHGCRRTRSAGTVRSGSRAPSASGSIRRDARSSRFR